MLYYNSKRKKSSSSIRRTKFQTTFWSDFVLLIRDQEEKTVKGLKKIDDSHKQRHNEIWEENDYLKIEKEKLGDELERRNEMLDEDKNRELLSELY